MRTIATFLPDLLSVAAFILLVIRGYRALARGVVRRISDTCSANLDQESRIDLEEFMAAAFETNDMQRRTNLAALVTLGGVLALVGDARFAWASAVLGSVWVLFYYITSQLSVLTEMSRPVIRETRQKLIWIFGSWVIISISIKIIVLSNLFGGTDQILHK